MLVSIIDFPYVFFLASFFSSKCYLYIVLYSNFHLVLHYISVSLLNNHLFPPCVHVFLNILEYTYSNYFIFQVMVHLFPSFLSFSSFPSPLPFLSSLPLFASQLILIIYYILCVLTCQLFGFFCLPQQSVELCSGQQLTSQINVFLPRFVFIC